MQALLKIGRARHFEAGQTLVDVGESPNFVGCVQRGFLRMQKTLHDGRQHIVGLLVEGDMFGRVFDGPMSFSIEAATDVDICAFQRKEFEALLLRTPELDRVVLLNILNELDRARDWMILLANPRVRARLAGFLLILCTRFAEVDHLVQAHARSLEVKIPISRADLAHLLGTRPESISRAFHALADSGSIAIKRPDLVEILDLDALTGETGEDEFASHASIKKLTRLRQRRTG